MRVTCESGTSILVFAAHKHDIITYYALNDEEENMSGIFMIKYVAVNVRKENKDRHLSMHLAGAPIMQVSLAHFWQGIRLNERPGIWRSCIGNRTKGQSGSSRRKKHRLRQ